jgi:hypothetical protein
VTTQRIIFAVEAEDGHASAILESAEDGPAHLIDCLMAIAAGILINVARYDSPWAEHAKEAREVLRRAGRIHLTQ